MNTKFSLALLASAAMARVRLDTSGRAEFLDYIGTFNKEYGSTSEMNKRMQVWLGNKKFVDDLNAANAGTGVKFGMNDTGDMTDEEFAKMRGLGAPPQDYSPYDPSDSNDNGGLGGLSGLQNDQSVNWVAQGKVGPVKNQGQCGSCWAFAATTVQESMQAIENGQPVVRLSEQEGVDCDPFSSGCAGGWMSYYWNMSHFMGSQPESTYPYEAKDGKCRNQAGKPIASRAAYPATRILGGAPYMKEALQDGPISVAVYASESCWRYYESGILSEENNCPYGTGVDHGVAVVGLVETGDKPYWIIQNSWGTGWGESGFMRIEVVGEFGISAMNTYAERMTVQSGYPKDGDETQPDCGHDERFNPLGPGKCEQHLECTGYRTCSRSGECEGDSGCNDKDDEDEEEEEEEDAPAPTPEMCEIDEDFNEMGPGRCESDGECKGNRKCCPRMNYCVGPSNCPDDEEEEKIDQCKIDESKNPLGPHQCSRSDQCKGARWCEDGFCQGKSNCEDDQLTPEMKCQIKEKQNFGGKHRCWQNDDDCRGNRTCGEDGFCTGYCGCGM